MPFETNDVKQIPLTPKMLVILNMYADGMNKAEIAVELNRSPHTVQRQCETLRARLGADNMYQAIAMAFRRGLIQ